MGASEGEGGGAGADCGVGAIVWVRRRNGSWWPGRILGQEELSASHLMSPRSGTPVKLLGREDASVDWYNLEKSKRVKPFRCGEFDACIERAEASQGVPIKKREKYARREDAILHALELEKQYLEKQWQKHGANSNTLSHKLSGNSKKMMNSSSLSGVHLRDNENLDHAELVSSELQSRSRRVDFPFEEPSKSMPLHFQKGNHGKQMNWNDDNSPLLPHTGGLKDFDLHVAPLKGKEPSSALCENSQLASSDDDVDEIPNLHGIKELNDTGGVKNPTGVKRKISYATLMEESLVKRRDRRRPLTQVIQNSIKLPVKSLQGNGEWESGLGKELKEQSGAAHHAERSGCISLPANSIDCFNHTGHSPDPMQLSPTESGYSNGNQPGSLLGGDGSSGLIGDGETSSSAGDYLVADLDEEAGLHQGNSEEHASECVSAPGGGQEKLGKMSNNYDMSLSDYKVPAVSNDLTGGCADIRVSKWHTKGKRNVRNLTRKSMEAFDGKDSAVSSDKCSGSLDGSVEKKPCIFKTGWERLSGQGLYHKDEELNYVYDDGEFFEKDNRVIGFGKHNYPLMLKAASRNHIVHGINDSDEDSHKMFASVWEANEPPHFVQRPYWEESDGFLDAHHVRPVDVDMAPRLVDVNLKVKASYQGEHVPLVSLMSRLNGKAIIGHPVHIEILEDGSSDLLCPRNHLGVSTTAVGELAAPTAWRTGKRTAMQRVPRSHLALSAQGEESEFIPYSDGEGRPPFKKPYVATKHCPHLKKSSKRKSHKKLSKKRSLPSQRTRALSSIAMEKKSNRVNASSKHRRRESGLDGLIKPGSTVPLITCVPVKVVFTRILEAIGRPPSASTTDPSLLACSIKRTSS